MDIVIPYRRSSSNELRYALRSLKNFQHDRLFVIGDRPILLQGIIHIPYNQTTDVAQNTLNIVNIAANDKRISDDFVLMHDDMYIMRKIDSIPVHHRGTYQDIIDSYTPVRRRGYYVNRMQMTCDLLNRLGFVSPLCYELHIPFVINKQRWIDISPIIKGTYNKLSIYGNFYHIGGTKMDDVKVRKSIEIPKGDFISTFDSTFNNMPCGKYIMGKFPESSKYEKQYRR